MSQTEQDLSAGRVVDERFELEELLGEGGFGVVYRARQISTGQPVAIKFMHTRAVAGSSLADQAVERFEREMKVIALLKHPNIVRLVDTGKLEDGTLYNVLEFVDGVDLGTLLRQEGRLAEHEACRLMGQVLEALSCAHEASVVHRDLKPENIMITRAGARRNALVLDFGIAGLIEPEDAAAGSADTMDAGGTGQRLTVTGQFIGTPSYMAPEQFSGESPTAQSDIYSWGLVFLEALTGKVAVSAASLPELLMKHMSEDPVPMPDSLAERPLGKLIAKATAKSLHARYQSAEELLHDLDEVAANASIEVRAIESAMNPFDETADVSDAVSDAKRISRDTGEAFRDISTQRGNSSEVGVVDPEDAEPEPVEGSEPSDSSTLTLAVVGLFALVLVAGGVLLVVALGGDGETDTEESAEASDEATPDAEGPAEESDASAVAQADATTGEETPEQPPETAFELGVPVQPEGTRGGEMLLVEAATLPEDGSEVRNRLSTLCQDISAPRGEPCDATAADLGDIFGRETAPLLLDKEEVRNSDYTACVVDGACTAIDYGRCLLMGRSGDFEVHALRGEKLARIEATLGGDALPATCIAASEAERFCKWAGKRLPTEAELVAAATGGGETLFPWGDSRGDGLRANGADSSLAESMRWDEVPLRARLGGDVADGEPFAAATGRFVAGRSVGGHVDLVGNVREWVADDDGAGRLPSAARGGGWADAGPWLTAWVRTPSSPDTRRADLGFRCAVSVADVAARGQTDE